MLLHGKTHHEQNFDYFCFIIGNRNRRLRFDEPHRQKMLPFFSCYTASPNTYILLPGVAQQGPLSNVKFKNIGSASQAGCKFTDRLMLFGRIIGFKNLKKRGMTPSQPYVSRCSFVFYIFFKAISPHSPTQFFGSKSQLILEHSASTFFFCLQLTLADVDS